MKVTEHINKSKSTLFSFEILPPIKGRSINSIYESIDPLIEFNPSFINVTYHREEFIYKTRELGYLEKVAVRKRPGTVGICSAIINKYKIDAIPHLICGGFTKEETENALIDLQYLGIDNVLALRGDPVKTEKDFISKEGGHTNAVDLVKQINNINHGNLLDTEASDDDFEFCIGVAGYPEKHIESPNFEIDLLNLKSKVDAGADYIVTQLFYDNSKFFKFKERCKEVGINIPIIPGLKPISSINQIKSIPKTFNIDLPFELCDMLYKAKDDVEVNQIGIDWCINQSKELIKNGVPCLHYYTMGKSESIKKILKNVF